MGPVRRRKTSSSRLGEYLPPGIAQFIQVLDSGFVDEDLLAATDLEGIAVIPLDAALDLLPSSRAMTVGICDWICFCR
jgi:Flp pilus assembly CpaE family ATPase